MKEATAWAVGWVFGGLTVLGLAGVIAWSVNNTSTLYNEKVIACVENGGTWLDYNSMCLQSGVKLEDSK